jgi:hypothetical protein
MWEQRFEVLYCSTVSINFEWTRYFIYLRVLQSVEMRVEFQEAKLEEVALEI